MANRSWSNAGHFYAPHVFPCLVDVNFAVGASGAVGTTKGPGVTSVTRLSAGRYRIKLQDNYTKFFAAYGCVSAPVSGSDVAVTAITPGVVYQITVLGTTTTAQWVTAGLPVGLTPAVGQTFLAAATSAGTGQVKVIGVSGISGVEVMGASNVSLALQPASAQGGYIDFQCLGATDASTTTLIPTDPASGSLVSVSLYLGNSSIVVQGE
jgi:hypothetical protein